MKTRNQSLELGKFIAACFVVFIHAPFPGKLGQAIDCLAKFAVPFFFAISGYYSLNIGEAKIKKRIVYVLKLHLFTALLCIGSYCILTPLSGGTTGDVVYFLRNGVVPKLWELAQWIVLQVNPYGGHLWYLSALLLCYLVLLGYVRFWQGQKQDNRPLYFAGFVLFAIYISLTSLLAADGMILPYQATRSGWLTGIPMFTMGMFLHEYEERFPLSSKKLGLLVVLGIAMSLIQSFAGFVAEIPLGMFLTVPGLLLFLAGKPRIPVLDAMGIRLGVISTAVYLLHFVVIDTYNAFLRTPVANAFPAKADSLKPLIILALTLAVSFLWERIGWLRKK